MLLKIYSLQSQFPCGIFIQSSGWPVSPSPVSLSSSVVPIPTSELVHHVLFPEFLSFGFCHVCLHFVNEQIRAFCSQLHKTKLSPVCMPGIPGVFIDGHRVGRVPPLSWNDWGRAFFLQPERSAMSWLPLREDRGKPLTCRTPPLSHRSQPAPLLY